MARTTGVGPAVIRGLYLPRKISSARAGYQSSEKPYNTEPLKAPHSELPRPAPPNGSAQSNASLNEFEIKLYEIFFIYIWRTGFRCGLKSVPDRVLGGAEMSLSFLLSQNSPF